MKEHLNNFGKSKSIKIIKSNKQIIDNNISYYIVSSRKYTKLSTKEEIAFMKYLLPEKAKFTPIRILYNKQNLLLYSKFSII